MDSCRRIDVDKAGLCNLFESLNDEADDAYW